MSMKEGFGGDSTTDPINKFLTWVLIWIWTMMSSTI